MMIHPIALVRRSCLLLVTALMVSCGGGGVVPSNGVSVRPLPAEYSTRNAVAYSPFRSANRDTETITAAMIKEDLDLLVAGNFKLIRLFDSSDSVAKATLQVITANAMDIKVHLGVYILSGNDTFNQAEIARGIALANQYPSQVLVVSVGNETMVNWSFNRVAPAQMATYITQVRNGIKQPVTTDDNYAFFAAAPAEILRAIDFVALHTYSLIDSVTTPGSWDWRQEGAAAGTARAAAMMDASIVKAKQDYAAARTFLDRIGYNFLPIIIGETGWKARVTSSEVMRAHPVNQKMYFDRLNAWRAASLAGAAGPKTIVYFEAFDETWKGGDDGWGLFNVSRKARYVVQSLYPSAIWEAGTYTAADALYYIAPIVTGPITANNYTVFAETLAAGAVRPAETLIWNAWQSGTTATAVDTATSAAEGTISKLITPTPLVWGWGMTMSFQLSADDLTNFNTSPGHLNFSIKTTYPGKLEVGFLTGTAANSTLYDVYIPIQSGDYGYVNDGAWHTVSIPITAITPHGAPAFGMPTTVTLDMTKVTNPFVIADRYAVTGKTTSSTTPILVDNIYWSK